MFKRFIFSFVVIAIYATTFTGATNAGGNYTAAETVAYEPQAETTPATIPEKKPVEMTVTATAYCHCNRCCGKSDGITATGTRATAGRTIAVDPLVIPYGAEVIINGHTYIAEDCGGAIKGNKIDVYFETHEEALQFGRQIVTVKYLV